MACLVADPAVVLTLIVVGGEVGTSVEKRSPLWQVGSRLPFHISDLFLEQDSERAQWDSCSVPAEETGHRH